jgi:hypothetical protein
MSELAEPMALVQHTPRTSRASPNLAESWLLARSHGSNNTCIIGITVHHTALACPSSHIFFFRKRHKLPNPQHKCRDSYNVAENMWKFYGNVVRILLKSFLNHVELVL